MRLPDLAVRWLMRESLRGPQW